MRNAILIIHFTIISLSTLGQPANWGWANGAGESYNDDCKSVCTDINGNVYATGYYSNTSITFGSITLVNPSGSSSSQTFYIVKYDASGNVLWAKSALSYSSEGLGITTDGFGNVFVVGGFYSSAISFDTISVSNVWGSDMFVVKYDASGNAIWAHGIGGTAGESAVAVTTDAGGNVYITGVSNSASVVVGSTTYTSSWSHMIVNVKYNNSGAVVWSNATSEPCSIGSYSLKADPAGNTYLVGYFFNSSISFGTITLPNSGGTDGFIVKYDPSGTPLWANKVASSGYEVITGVSLDNIGNVYATGYFGSTPVNLGTTTLTSGGGDDAFIIKYNSSGVLSWAKSIGGSSGEQGMAITTDGTNIFTTGFFNSPAINFDAITLNNTGPANRMYVAKLNAAGNYIWAQECGNINNSFSRSITTDYSGNAYICGSYYAAPITFGTTILPSAGAADLFVTQIPSLFTSSQNIGEDETILISPNPFATQTTIDLNTDYKNATLKIVDIMGKELRSIKFSGKHIDIQKGELNSGIYFIQIISEYKLITNKKIIIQ